MIFRSQAIIFPLRIGSKWVPNRIIDSEGVRKPLDRHLGRYHSALRGILAALGRAGGGPGGVLGGAGAVLEAYKARLGRSLGRLGAILGALEAMLQPPGGQKAPKIGAQEGPKSSSFWHRF